ncbi:hypothetical protein HGI36_27380, partial [Clostridium beijerinckii]|nr:hypothetical protein [Clostridium beijerinckii]
DYDPGASEVNQLNRIKLMLSVAHKNLQYVNEHEDVSRRDSEDIISELNKGYNY